MTIEGEDFILTPINEHSLGFDLELLQTINKYFFILLIYIM